MAFMEFPAEIIFLLLCIISFFLYKTRKSSSILTDWPLFGMIPALFYNTYRVHDFVTDLLKQSNATFVFKGLWFANMDMVVTSDPANVHYMLSKNFSNYPKGPEFRKIFDILGDGIFNSDSELWEIHRKTTLSLFTHAKFQNMLQRTLWNKVEKGLIPVLDFASKQGVEMDLQEIFQRFTFDGICKLALDYDPESLAIDFPYIPCEKAFTDTEEALLYRHIFPESFWKLLNRLEIGKEKKLTESWKYFDQFIYKCISSKEEELSTRSGAAIDDKQLDQEDFELLTAFMTAYKEQGGTSGNPRKFLRDTLLSLMVAGRDTTSTGLTWFFYLLAKNPLAEKKILEEIHTKLQLKEGEKWKIFSAADMCKLVYLHGALCEALRLFPPVAFEHKAPLEPDVLPTGHRVDENSKIILSFYSMGRMETIWGEDCLAFKPERWFSERGGIKHEPSYKFTAFHAGPRTCLGKQMAFIQMKMVASTIIYKYEVELMEGHPVCPSDSIILQMKHGLKVKLTKRNANE